MAEFKFDGYNVFFDDSDAVKEAVFNKILQFYYDNNAFNGESIMQNDGPIIEAPGVLAKIADDIIKFKVEYYED